MAKIHTSPLMAADTKVGLITEKKYTRKKFVASLIDNLNKKNKAIFLNTNSNIFLKINYIRILYVRNDLKKYLAN